MLEIVLKQMITAPKSYFLSNQRDYNDCFTYVTYKKFISGVTF